VAKAVIKIGADASELKTGVAEASAEVDKLQQRITRKADTSLGRSLAADLKEIKDSARNVQTTMGDVQRAAGAAAQSFGAMASQFYSAGAGVEDLRRKLSATFTADQVGPLTEAIRELGATPPFSGEQFAQAAATMQKFGVEGLATAENLTRIGNVAAATGNSVESLAQIWGNLARGGEDAKRSILALSKEFGVSGRDLQQFGASVDATGKLLVGTPAQADAARQALERLADSERFSGSMDRMAGGVQLLQAQLELFRQDGGRAMAQFADQAGGSLARFLAGLRETAPPLAEVIGMSTAVAGSLASAGSKALELGAQASVLAQGLARAQVSIQSMGGTLAALTASASQARVAMMALATTPIGVALMAIAAGYVAISSSISSYERQQREMSERLDKESRDLQDSVQMWRQYREALEGATGARIGFNSTPTNVAGDVSRLLEAGDPSRVVRAMQDAGITVDKLREDVGRLGGESREAQDALTNAVNETTQAEIALMRIRTLSQVDNQVHRERVQEAEQALDTALLSEQQARLTLDNRLKSLSTSRGLLQVYEGFEPALARAVEQAKGLDAYLKFADKAQDARVMREALGEVESALSRLQTEAAKRNLPAFSADSLRSRLLDSGLSEADRAAAETILSLLDERRRRQEAIQQFEARAASERIRLMDQEFSRSQAGRDQDLQATIRHLEHKLQAVRGNVVEETQVLNQLHQARTQQRQEEVQSQRTALQEAIRTATEQTERLASSGEGTAAQVAEGYRGVLRLLDDWARAHQVLLDQVPELRQEYDRLREDAQRGLEGSERSARADQLAALREQAQELQAGARGQQEQLEATRQSLELYERVLRSSQDLRSDAESRKTLQREINDLRRREADLVEQMAERERQSAQQTAGLSQQLLDAEIATLETRQRAGEDVEAELRSRRSERFQAALEMIQMETDAEIRAAEGREELIEEARKRGMLRRRILEEQERQRRLSGLRQEVLDVEDAEAQKDRARKRFRPEDRIGGEHSPIMTVEEAFADVLPGLQGLKLGGLQMSGKKADSAPGAEDELKKLGETAQQTGKSLAELPPVQAEFGAAATAGGVSLRELAAAASQAAASLRSISGGGAGGGGAGAGGTEASPMAPAGTTTDGKFSYAPGYGPEGARLVSDGGYPTTGYPGLMARTMPVPPLSAPAGPRISQANNSNRTEVHQTVMVDGRVNTEPQAQVVAREVAKLIEQQQQRKRLMAGPWR
jgi:hypothetical protein